jgi:hypothetical protein
MKRETREVAPLTVTRILRGRPPGHVGPYWFGFDIKVSGGRDGADLTVRARSLAMADAKALCNEVGAPDPVLQFEQSSIGWNDPEKFEHTVCFGTGLSVEEDPL